MILTIEIILINSDTQLVVANGDIFSARKEMSIKYYRNGFHASHVLTQLIKRTLWRHPKCRAF
jgi:hypothetical protein